MMIAPMPTSVLRPISHPCTMAPWPTVQRSPMTTGQSASTCTMAFSWMLVCSPMTTGASSPRICAPASTHDSLPMRTSPTMPAAGEMRAFGWMRTRWYKVVSLLMAVSFRLVSPPLYEDARPSAYPDAKDRGAGSMLDAL